MSKNIYILGTTLQTSNLIESLMSKFSISGVITLKSSVSSKDVAGYINLNYFVSKYKIPVYEVQSYSLKDKKDKNLILDLKIDILIVFGWQRLVPIWLLQHVSVAAIGVHGSPDGITQGRGRSPQNWSLILGAQKFYFSLFHLSEGIDSGNIIASTSYSISLNDDIASIYNKLTVMSVELISNFLSNPFKHLESSKIQVGVPYYYPKRIATDGAIDWRSNSETIHNLIRALTKPYPGAFTFYQNQKIFIWKAELAYNINGTRKQNPGVVISKNLGNKLCVATGNGYINILEYDCDSPLEIQDGDTLISCPEKEIIGNIIQRHYHAHPELTISPRLLNYWRTLDE